MQDYQSEARERKLKDNLNALLDPILDDFEMIYETGSLDKEVRN